MVVLPIILDFQKNDDFYQHSGQFNQCPQQYPDGHH